MGQGLAGGGGVGVGVGGVVDYCLGKLPLTKVFRG